MEYSLEVNGLTKKYNGFNLNDVSLNLRSGSIMGFIGENGAGKSTTIKAILNIISKDSGRVRLLGVNMDDRHAQSRAKEQIGVVLDECHYHENLSAEDIQKFLSRLYTHWDRDLYSNYLERFQLSPRKLIKEYSRGMKMKLCIAAALAHKPKLLILDEATSGLDPVVRNEILDVFFDFIQDESHSILMSSHITSDLERVCDYITFIHKGTIILSESKDELLNNYGILKCTKKQYEGIDKSDYISSRSSSYGYEMLVADKSAAERKYGSCTLDRATLEDIMLFYSKNI